jgi:hypothetical protein
MTEIKIDEQEVFNKAREDLEFYFGLKLSLSQQVKLRRVYVPQSIEECKKTHPLAFTYTKIKNPANEAVARFIWNNFTLDLESIETGLLGWPLERVDEQAY